MCVQALRRIKPDRYSCTKSQIQSEILALLDAGHKLAAQIFIGSTYLSHS